MRGRRLCGHCALHARLPDAFTPPAACTDTYHKALHKAEEIHEQLVQRSSYWFVMAQYYRLRAVGRRITRAVESSYRPQVFKERTQRARAMRQERPITPKVTPGKRKH